jgi:hypothetical protein
MSLKQEVENVFEELREKLVSLLGDHHGVHATVDDAKSAINPHVPTETSAAEQTTPTTNVGNPSPTGEPTTTGTTPAE